MYGVFSTYKILRAIIIVFENNKHLRRVAIILCLCQYGWNPLRIYEITASEGADGHPMNLGARFIFYFWGIFAFACCENQPFKQ